MTAAAVSTRHRRRGAVIRARLAGLAFTAAPVGALAGWTVMRLGASRGPGPGWVLAHAVWLVGYGLFAVVVVELCRRTRAPRAGGRTAVIVSTTVALIGIVAIIGQMIVDMTVGLAAADRQEMDGLYQRVFEVPGVHPVLYGFGPGLLGVGLLALLVHLAALRRIAFPTVLLAAAGTVLIAVEGAAGALRLPVTPAGAVCLWLALAPLGRRLPVAAGPSEDVASPSAGS